MATKKKLNDFTRIDAVLQTKDEVPQEKLNEIGEMLLPRIKDLMFEDINDKRTFDYTFDGKDALTKGQLKWVVALLKRTENGFVSRFVPKGDAVAEEIEQK
jgi:hypothetical protein